MLVLFINAHRSLLLHMNDVCKSSVAKSDWCPIFDWWILLPKPGAMTEEVCTSEPWNRAEIWASKQQQLKRPDVFRCFQHTFFGVQKPSKTIKNHQEPSKTIKNHQKPSKTIKIHASQGDVHGFFQGDLLSTKLQGAGAGQSWQPHGGRLSATHG